MVLSHAKLQGRHQPLVAWSLMPPLSKEKPGGCDRRRAAASSLIIVDRFNAFFRVVFHAVDFATNCVRLHQAFIVGPQ